MPIRCQCHVITEATFVEAIKQNREKIADMPLTDAANFIFQQVRTQKLAAGETSKNAGKGCLSPCRSAIQMLINEIETVDAPTSCRGYDDQGGCAAAGMLSAMLMEIK